MSKKNFGAGPEWFFLAALLAPSALQASRPLGRKIANSLEELGRLLNEAMDEADAAEQVDVAEEKPAKTAVRAETSNVVKSADDVPQPTTFSGPGLATGFAMKGSIEEPKKSVFEPEVEPEKAADVEVPKAVEPVKPVAFEAPKPAEPVKPEFEAGKPVEPVAPVAFEAPKPVEPVKPVAFEAPKPELEAVKPVEPVAPVAFEAPKPVEPVKPVAFDAPKPVVAQESEPVQPVAVEAPKAEFEPPKPAANPFAAMGAAPEPPAASPVTPRPFEAIRSDVETPAPEPDAAPKIGRTLGEAVMNQTWNAAPRAETADELLQRFEVASGGAAPEPPTPAPTPAPVPMNYVPPTPAPAPLVEAAQPPVSTGEFQLPKPPSLESAPIPKVEDILPHADSAAPKGLTPEEIAARFEDGPVAAPEVSQATAPTPEPTPAPKALTPEEIAARFESGDAAPAPVAPVAPVQSAPSKGLSPDEIAARFEAAQQAPTPAAPQEIAAQFESAVSKAASEQPIANPMPVSALPFEQEAGAQTDTAAAEWGSMLKPAEPAKEPDSVGTWVFAEQKKTQTGPPPTQAAPPRRPQDAEVLRKGFEQQQPGAKRSLRERMGFKSNRQQAAPPPAATVASGPPPLQVMPGSAPQNAAPPVQRNRFVVPSDVDTA